MKKEEVFVVIDSKKVAKKLSKVLAMFNEIKYNDGVIGDALRLKEVIHFWNNHSWTWCESKYCVSNNKKLVPVSELKQILAMEHLKKGDVVVCDLGNEKGIVEFSHFDTVEPFKLISFKWNYKGDTAESVRGGYFYKFIRYATEEEKQLLNPCAKEDEKHTGSFESLRKCDSVDFPNDFKEVEKPIKELKVGNWYKFGTMGLYCFQGYKKEHYGFDGYGHWSSSLGHMENQGQATQEEVAERFFKECHNRYPNKIGFKFNHDTNEITAGGEIVFKNGTWLEAKKIEIDPFKELKEAHKKGFEIEYKSSSGQWKTSSNPAWRKTGNYRIRPVKIGDWFFTTHEQTNVKYYYQVNETNINDVKPNHVRILNKMVIDILNNGKYTV